MLVEGELRRAKRRGLFRGVRRNDDTGNVTHRARVPSLPAAEGDRGREGRRGNAVQPASAFSSVTSLATASCPPP
jgi:hypothetical protein